MPNERPAHRVHVDGFWMDATEVTNSEFAKFVTGIHDGGLPHEKSGASSKLKILPQEKHREISALRTSCSLRCFARGLWRRRLQHDPPTDPKQKAYRLSAPERGFSLDLRLYGPDHSLRKGTWALAAMKVQVTRIRLRDSRISVRSSACRSNAFAFMREAEALKKRELLSSRTKLSHRVTKRVR
jgi:Sulfatase-modifying factor enzyme 1